MYVESLIYSKIARLCTLKTHMRLYTSSHAYPHIFAQAISLIMKNKNPIQKQEFTKLCRINSSDCICLTTDFRYY